MQGLTAVAKAKRPAPPGAWKPGQTGNPGGRPKGFMGLAAEVRRQTQDGAELVQWVLGVFRNENGQYGNEMRWKALEWLSDRGFGKPVQAIDLHQSVDPHSPQVDVSALPDADLAAMVALLELADDQSDLPAADEAQALLAGVIDAEATEVK